MEAFDYDLQEYLNDLAEADQEEVYCPDEMERADLERD
jgi:hypothetical protein